MPCLPPGDLPDPEIKPASLKSPALTGQFFTTSATWETQNTQYAASKKPFLMATVCPLLLQTALRVPENS